MTDWDQDALAVVPSDDQLDAMNAPSVYVRDDIAYYRASSLGKCTHALVAMRQGIEARRPPEDMQRRFNEGHLHEDDIMRRVEKEYGIRVHSRQAETAFRIGSKIVVTGHIDGRGVSMGEDEQHQLVVDAKTAANSAFKDWLKCPNPDDPIGQALWLQKEWPTYWWQGGAYLADSSHDNFWGVCWAVKNKESGEMRLVFMPRVVFPTKSDIIRRVMEIEKVAVTMIPPLCEGPFDYPCPVYWAIHAEKPVVLRPIEDQRVIDEKVKRYQDLKAQVVEAERKLANAKKDLLDIDDGGAEGIDFKYSAFYGSTTAIDWDKFKADHPDIDIERYKTKQQHKEKQIRVTDLAAKRAAKMRTE